MGRLALRSPPQALDRNLTFYMFEWLCIACKGSRCYAGTFYILCPVGEPLLLLHLSVCAVLLNSAVLVLLLPTGSAAALCWHMPSAGSLYCANDIHSMPACELQVVLMPSEDCRSGSRRATQCVRVQCRPALRRGTDPEVGGHVAAERRREIIHGCPDHCRCYSLDVAHTPPMATDMSSLIAPLEDTLLSVHSVARHCRAANCAAAATFIGQRSSCNHATLHCGLASPNRAHVACHSIHADSLLKVKLSSILLAAG